MNKLTIVGFVAGTTYLFMAILWYYIRYPNTNEFLECIAIAILIIGCAYLYERLKRLEGKFDYFEDNFQDYLNELKEKK